MYIVCQRYPLLVAMTTIMQMDLHITTFHVPCTSFTQYLSLSLLTFFANMHVTNVVFQFYLSHLPASLSLPTRPPRPHLSPSLSTLMKFPGVLWFLQHTVCSCIKHELKMDDFVKITKRWCSIACYCSVVFPLSNIYGKIKLELIFITDFMISVFWQEISYFTAHSFTHPCIPFTCLIFVIDFFI